MKPQIGIAVDGSAEGNPGIGEYQGKDLATGKVLFKSKRYSDMTNNVAEWLACVHAIAYCNQNHLDTPIYSDSSTARAWVRQGHCNTQHVTSNTELATAIAKANAYLQEHPGKKIETWDTRAWGQNIADFGKKGWLR